MFPLLGANHRLPLLHMAKIFIHLPEKNERINEFAIGYMINPILHANKAFKDKVLKCMNNRFGNVTQPFIKNVMKKKNLCIIIIIVL